MSQTAIKKRPRTIRIDPNVKMCEPSKMTIEVVTENSRSDKFDEAKIEWELKSVVYEDTDGFNNLCDLCGNTSLKYNFIINNPYTNKELCVGSHCIIRFGLIKGNVDAESGMAMINNFMKNQKHYNIVRGLIKSMMAECVDAREYKTFLDSLGYLLKYMNKPEPTLNELGEICYGDRWEYQKQFLFKCDKLRRLWYEPTSISIVRAKGVKFKQITEKDTYWGKKRGSVYMPGAARSEAFKTDKISD